MSITVKCSRVKESSAPRRLRNHPLIHDRTFYTLPISLWNLIWKYVGRDRFDPRLLKIENVLSKKSGDHTFTVGYQDGMPIMFHLLRRERWTLSSREQRFLRKSSAHVGQSWLNIVNGLLDQIAQPARAYSGWLLSNRNFIGEHDLLLKMCPDQEILNGMFTFGIHFVHQLPGEITVRRVRGQKGAALEEWFSSCHRFCHRWRLEKLAGPYLPQPLQPHVPDLRPGTNASGAATGTQLFFPDTFPVSGRGLFPRMLEDALRGVRPDDHLVGWMDIVASANTSKNTLGRLARLFELRHFYRVLYQRHAGAMHRRMSHLHSAFAEFFHVSEDSIQNDVNLLAYKFGKEWYLRPDPTAKS